LFNIGFLEFTFWDIVDIAIFGYLLYILYRVLKGAVAFYILLGIVIVYAMWWIFRLLDMHLMSNVIGQFTSIGVILLIVVFQPEIRQFLIMLGTTASRNRFSFLRNLKNLDVFKKNIPLKEHLIQEIKGAILSMAKNKTGALIIFAREDQLNSFKSAGVHLDARISHLIIESIFEKNSPMHDGAMIIVRDRVYAASSILPISYDPSLPLKYGLRHRAAIGASELTDIIAIVISEESGTISFVQKGKIEEIDSDHQLQSILERHEF
jgi:diadenylate cyclase